jgi:aspartate racemase
MKVIGLLGGMSWESTTEYYRLINEAVKERLGGLHSAKCVLYSVDFAEVAELQRQGKWSDAAQLLAVAAQNVERAGAELVVLCTNTMHKVADTIQARIGIPLLHIADATAEKVKQAGIRRVGLLGTRFTMEDDFYQDRLISQFGLEVLIPGPKDRETVHRIIYEELCLGIIRSESKARVASIMTRLGKMGTEGIILGCTELGLLIRAKDSHVPLFDTTHVHALAAVEHALK